ncbi:MAG: FTR1 family protein [Nocardioides sp.]|uniref:iron uptake transporter permease EfeU n=1 Tax=Nocardioides sp. TaxID=35761 RepID=UPI0039E69156
MLPTFVIGLREGLEAVLIVAIIATFLRRNGASLRGLWIGVGAGVALSIAVGLILRAVEKGLPQRQQEMMETVIGVVAVFFVTGMILWMRTHARSMKKELESAAAQALKDGTTTALAVMAFLAVLREGFETAVFLLATFQSTSGTAPLFGAMLGILAAVVLGWGIFAGGVRLNLQVFFKYTGIFLVLVAAGLVLNAFRTAHEAGWVTVGQGRTVDLAWLTPPGSVRSALFTGVLGIPSDPRVIELLAWAAYLVPMLVVTFWPRRYLPSATLAQRLRVGGAAAMLLVGAVLLVAAPRSAASVPASAPLDDGGTVGLTVHGGGATLTLTGLSGDSASSSDTLELTRAASLGATGASAGADTRWTATEAAGDLPSTLDLTTLLTYTDNQIPVGLSTATAPGPYDASWTDSTAAQVLSRDGGILDAESSGRLILTISGGGLTSPRTFTIDSASWRVSPGYASSVQTRVAAAAATAHDRSLWKFWVPCALLLGAAVLLGQARRHAHPRRLGVLDPAHSTQGPASKGNSHDSTTV